MGSALPAIVLVGYDRLETIARLHASLLGGHYPPGVPLVVSLDHGGGEAIGALADSLPWPHGPKRVIRHPGRLGLRDHILACGDLTRDYGAVIVLEDDLLAASHLYAYARAAIDFYADDPLVGGVATYSYRLNEFNNMDFEPIDDGSDVYFLQVASSWGQAWTRAQWQSFRAWYDAQPGEPYDPGALLPRQLAAWRPNSWKKWYIKYLTDTGRTFVFPRAGQSTNMATPGTNTRRHATIYQVPLDMGPRDWRFVPFARSRARYDVFFEPDMATLADHQPVLAGHDFDVDLFGTKPDRAMSRPWLLSSRPCRQPVASFGLVAAQAPAVAVALGTPGRFLSLAPRERFGPMTLGRRWALARKTQHGEPLNKLLFQLTKPIQSELMIRKATRRHG